MSQYYLYKEETVKIYNKINSDLIIKVKNIKKDLSGADLRGADLCSADLCSADLFGADLRCAYLSGADLRDADLRDADLCSADLRGANLFGSHLSGSDLRDANLSGANLSGSDLRGADLFGSHLSKNKIDIFSLKGSMHQMIYIKHLRQLQIGCEMHNVDYWLDYYEKIGIENDYTIEQIAEYKEHIDYIISIGKEHDML